MTSKSKFVGTIIIPTDGRRFKNDGFVHYELPGTFKTACGQKDAAQITTAKSCVTCKRCLNADY